MKSKFYWLGAVAICAIALAGYQLMKARQATSAAGISSLGGACSPDSPADSASGCMAPAAPGVARTSSNPKESEKLLSTQASADRPGAVSAEDRKKLEILGQVLASRNDNDPRLDRELKVLAPGARGLLRTYYGQLAAEKRNERGTVVFLLGRNLEKAEDFDFLSGVVGEAPCRSLRDCQSADAMDSHDPVGSEMGIDVTLNYPQVVVLKSLERLLSGSPSADQRARAIAVLHQAMGSPVPIVSTMATDLYNRYGGKSS